MDNLSVGSIARMIDHSLLHPAMSDDVVAEGCSVARRHGVATACVKPCSVAMASGILEGSGVGVCAVVSFPHGNSLSAIKTVEAEIALEDGASEIDMVVNIGKVIGGKWIEIAEEIGAVNAAVTAAGGILKVIFENDYLDDDAIIRLCEICSERRVAFVKTSTGYGFVRQENGMYTYRGATDHHLKLMRAHCAPDVQIKAAGGVRTLDDVLRVRELGVTRIGATTTEAILRDAERRFTNN